MIKLFTKYNRTNIAFTVIIFLLGSMAFTFLIRYVIINQIDEDLKIEMNEVKTYIQRYKRLPSIIEVHDQYTTYKSISKPVRSVNKIFTHKAYDFIEHENELQRSIEFSVLANGNWFLVCVSKSLEGTDVLIKTIIGITISVILLILAATFFINRIVLKRLWKPFYYTLEKTQTFNLKAQKINFEKTNIEEFYFLNKILSAVLNKAQSDYNILKDFTENASHELQTPLAVIQSKLDILIQNEKLSENESTAIQTAYNAISSLRKLNQSLLLLAKIENNQFNEQININLREVLSDKINQFGELWKNGGINAQIELTDTVINGNMYLIEILLNNLLGNAVKHNVANGIIRVTLNNSLQITNTGDKQSLNKNMLFKRFTKQTTSAESHGLGLSVVYQICESSGFVCSYNFELPNLHSFTVKFNVINNQKAT